MTTRFSKVVPKSPLELERFYLDSFQRSGSSLTDIETREHAMLQAIGELNPASADATKDKHLSNAQGKVWQDHVGNTNNPHLTTAVQVGAEPVGTVATHAALTVTHGATGAIVGTTNVQVITNKTLNDNTNYIDSDAVHQIFYNNSGGVLAPGVAVVNTQWNAPNNATEVVKARANSATTCPCHGLVEASTADNAVGSIRTHGILNDINTAAWSEGVDLWLSPTTAGVLTTTMPTTVGQYQQFIGTVVKQHATTGIIAVNIGPALIVAAAGGGATTVTQVEVDFGATPLTDKEFTVTDAAISATSKIVVSPAYEDTTDKTADEIISSNLIYAAGKAAAGTFILTVASATEMLIGKYKFNYIAG